jgi:hypothetical protein
MATTDSNTSNLTENDWKVYNIKKEKMFKGTIAVCIIYAVIAAVLLILSYFVSNIREMVFVQFLPFTLLYIIGTIIIILALIIYIFSFEPTKVDYDKLYPSLSCPDYWNMEMLDSASLNGTFDPKYSSNLFKYRCVLNQNLFNKKDLASSNLLYSLTDSLDFTTTNDKIDTTSSSTKDNFNNAIDNTNHTAGKYSDLRHLYVDIIDNKDKIDNQVVYSNLLKAALVMNNYGTSNDGYYSNMQQSTSNYLIPPIAWKYSKLSQSTFTGGSTTVTNIIKSWNGLTYEKLINAYGTSNTTLGLYYMNSGVTPTKGAKLGVITINSNNITYAPRDNITWKPSTAPETGSAFITDSTVIDIDFTREALTSVADGTTTIASCTVSAESALSPYSSYYLGLKSPIIEYIESSVATPKDNFIPKNINFSTDLLSGSSKSMPLVCDSFYPLYMAHADNNMPGDLQKNELRCKYAELCGIPWSDMQC